MGLPPLVGRAGALDHRHPGHMWPDTDESINTAIGAVIVAQIEGFSAADKIVAG
jgi:hypothetical protein